MLRLYTALGRNCKAHPGCIEGFREDRRQGLIYSAILVKDCGEYQAWLTPEEASIFFGVCVYCNSR